MAAHFDILTKMTAPATSAPAIALARPRSVRSLGVGTSAAAMAQYRNDGENHALVARYLR